MTPIVELRSQTDSHTRCFHHLLAISLFCAFCPSCSQWPWVCFCPCILSCSRRWEKQAHTFSMPAALLWGWFSQSPQLFWELSTHWVSLMLLYSNRIKKKATEISTGEKVYPTSQTQSTVPHSRGTRAAAAWSSGHVLSTVKSRKKCMHVHSHARSHACSHCIFTLLLAGSCLPWLLHSYTVQDPLPGEWCCPWWAGSSPFTEHIQDKPPGTHFWGNLILRIHHKSLPMLF